MEIPVSPKLKRREPMKRILVVVTIVVLAVFMSGVLLAQTDSSVGTWKLNAAKSKSSPVPVPQSRTVTIEAQGKGVKASSEQTAADGTHTTWSYTANYDGKDNPISGTGAPGGADTVALKRINANTTETTWKKGGKVVNTGRSVVSKDGKVRTTTGKGTDANGQPTSAVSVYDKQ
jgi:hypothetical protein